MRVMIDTNVFISALLFPASTPSKATQLVMEKHKLILCSHITKELEEKIREKRPDLIPSLHMLLQEMSYENVEGGGVQKQLISDLNDMPILDAAICGKVDIIISGDKHFKALTLKKPKVKSPADFLRENS